MDTSYKLLLGQEAEKQFTRTEDIDVYFCWEREAKVSRRDIISRLEGTNPTSIHLDISLPPAEMEAVSLPANSPHTDATCYLLLV
jgi:hypothetical protein